MTGLKKLTACFLLCATYGCASVDFDYPKESSHAMTDTDSTQLGKSVTSIVKEQASGESGFYPMQEAIDALAVRILLAEEAERSLDAQYYLLTPDVVGYAFIDALLDAADRGVRVRLLLDDILTSGYDAGLAALDSHPNFEVRIFNPFANRSMRAIDGITSFSRVNRRMHNKSFTVDNQITLIGGRNIAAEYFGAREDSEFLDLDVLAVGPMVQEVSDMFDGYWNHRAAAPIPSFAKLPEDPDAELLKLRAIIEESMKSIIDTPYGQAVGQSISKYVDNDGEMFEWAPYELAVDSPDKSDKKRAAEAASITSPLRKSLENAEHEAIIISPYFVPRKDGIEWFIELEQKGVEVRIITNSLKANNQKAVHGGYAPSRKPLLQAGVEIYEVRADASSGEEGNITDDDGRATLHTKAFIVDRHDAFIGSFNFDPRSADINTELGVIIRSPEIAGSLATQLDSALREQTYEVFLNDKDQLHWRGYNDGEEVIFEKEPDTSGWDRFVAGFFRILPIRSQL